MIYRLSNSCQCVAFSRAIHPRVSQRLHMINQSALLSSDARSNALQQQQQASNQKELSEYAKKAIQKYTEEDCYGVKRLARFITRTSDKRAAVERSIVDAMRDLHLKTNNNSEELIKKAIHLLTPLMDCGSYKRGAKLVRVPLPLDEYRGSSLALRWIKHALQKRGLSRKLHLNYVATLSNTSAPTTTFDHESQDLSKRLVKEMLAILEGDSALLQKKAGMHREALLNRSFAHLRWHVSSPK